MNPSVSIFPLALGKTVLFLFVSFCFMGRGLGEGIFITAGLGKAAKEATMTFTPCCQHYQVIQWSVSDCPLRAWRMETVMGTLRFCSISCFIINAFTLTLFNLEHFFLPVCVKSRSVFEKALSSGFCRTLVYTAGKQGGIIYLSVANFSKKVRQVCFPPARRSHACQFLFLFCLSGHGRNTL